MAIPTINIDLMLKELESGKSMELNKVLNMFQSKSITDARMMAMIEDLDHHLLRLHFHLCRELITALLTYCPWRHGLRIEGEISESQATQLCNGNPNLQSNEYTEQITSFLVGLVASHPAYTDIVLEHLILSLRPPKGAVEKTPLKDRCVFHRVQRILRGLLENVPACGQPLVDLLKMDKLTPHTSAPTYTYCAFLLNLFCLADYLEYWPHLANDEVQLTLDKIVAVDVLGNDEENQTLNTSEEVENAEASCDFFNESVRNKRDLCLHIAFTHIRNKFFPDGEELNWPVLKQFYKRHLLGFFERSVLLLDVPHLQVQFLMFFVCNLKKDLAVGFIDFLWFRVRDYSKGAYLPQCAVSYLASFIMHSMIVDLDILMAFLQQACEWMLEYMDHVAQHEAFGGGGAIGSFQRHCVFYSVFNALVHICLSRQEDIFDNEMMLQQFRELRLKQILVSPLNPLRFCDLVMLNELEQLLEAYQVDYFCTVFTASRNLALFSRSNQRMGEHSLRLPFQEYHLRLSRHNIEPYLRKKQLAKKMKPLEEALETRMRDVSIGEEGAVSIEVGHTHTLDVDVGSFPHSMSVSPVNPFWLPHTAETEQVFLGRDSRRL